MVDTGSLPGAPAESVHSSTNLFDAFAGVESGVQFVVSISRIRVAPSDFSLLDLVASREIDLHPAERLARRPPHAPRDAAALGRFARRQGSVEQLRLTSLGVRVGVVAPQFN